MDLKAYGQAVLEGARSMLSAARDWRDNPLASGVNRRLWGPAWPAALLLLTAGAIAAGILIPPFSRLVQLVPPLVALAFLPGIVLDLFTSAAAFFAFIIAWRFRRLRLTAASDWPDRTAIPEFGGQFFDAAALPVVIAAIMLSLGLQLASAMGVMPAADPDAAAAMAGAFTVADSSTRIARTIVVVALVTGVLSVHRRFGAGFGKLLGVGFVVWGVHIGIAFTIPFLTNWWGYLPWVGQFAPERSAALAHALFDLSVACAAWLAAREKWSNAPLWTDVAPTPEPPPLPPPPPPPPGNSNNQA